MINLLLVEDDRNIQKLMTIWLKKEGFEVYTANNGIEAIDLLLKQKIHLLLADIMMPQMNGIELLEYMRQNNISVPIIMTTARENIEDKKTCFKLGADDYLVKPINREELSLRIRAVLKRSNVIDENILTVGSVRLDKKRLEVSSDKACVVLTKKEFDLLFFLLSFPDKVFTKNELLDEFWGYDTESFTDTIKVHINRIRTKIEPFDEIGVQTIRGVGYKGEIHAKS